MNSKRRTFRKTSSILVYGIGNPSRQDDALGILFADSMREWALAKGLSNISFDSNYQLNIEDALEISEKDIVIFADASLEEIETFKFRRLKPLKTIEMSTHSMRPESVLALCEELFGRKPEAYLITIRGYSWMPSEALTGKAGDNLRAALEHVQKLIG